MTPSLFWRAAWLALGAALLPGVGRAADPPAPAGAPAALVAGERVDVAADLAAAVKQAQSEIDASRFREALPLAQAAHRQAVDVLGARHAVTLDALRALAVATMRTGDALSGMTMYEALVATRAQVLGERHPDTLQSRSDLAYGLMSLGRLDEALIGYQDVLRLRTEAQGAGSPEALSGLNNVAAVLDMLGRTAEALPLYERALQLKRQTLGERAASTLMSQHNLAFMLNAVGRHDEALALIDQTLSQRTEVLGAEHFDTLMSVNNRANVLMAMGRPAEALPGFASAATRYATTFGPQSDPALSARANHADALSRVGRSDEALPMLEQAIDASMAAVGAAHPRVLAMQHQRAQALRRAGRRDEAVALFAIVVAARERVLGPTHTDTLTSLAAQAGTLAEAGRHAEAAPLFERFVAGAEQQRSLAMADSPELQRWLFTTLVPGYRAYAASLLASGRDREAMAVLDRSKARGLIDELAQLQARRAQVLPAADADQLSALPRAIAAIDTRIARAPAEASRDALRAQRQDVVRALAALQDRLEAQHEPYRRAVRAAAAQASDVTAGVSRGTLFVSYYAAPSGGFEAMSLDAAGRVRRHGLPEHPGLADSAEAYRLWTASLGGRHLVDDEGRLLRIMRWQQGGAPLWRAVAGTVPACGDPVTPACLPADAEVVQGAAEHARLGQYLGTLLLEPLRDVLQGVKRLVVSPEGPLWSLPWDLLPLDGQPLVQRCSLRLTHSLAAFGATQRRLVERARAAPANALGLLAIGNPDYGTDPTPRGELVVRGATRLRSGEGRAALSWPALPYTQIEVERAARIFGREGARTLTGRDATETRLRALSASGELARYRHLLLSAHGHFDPTLPQLSSLVLRPDGDEPERDGYVTTSEWTSLRLGSALTVLSACNTARGQSVNGDGLMGLSYALFLAGNANTVLTLWPVPDALTSHFVTDFLRRVHAGRPHAEALAETQRAFMHHPDRRMANPQVWAAFVLHGA